MVCSYLTRRALTFRFSAPAIAGIFLEANHESDHL
jgi:hypothetical protein